MEILIFITSNVIWQKWDPRKLKVSPIEKNICDSKTYEIEKTYNKFQACIYFDWESELRGLIRNGKCQMNLFMWSPYDLLKRGQVVSFQHAWIKYYKNNNASNK
jgi:hypothetical protein